MNSTVQSHSYHLVDPSPWPFVGSISCLMTTLGAVLYIHSYENGNILLSMGIIMILITMIFWWRDIIRESTYEGHHTTHVQTGLRYGMILFIVSEILLFFCFFLGIF
jgi:cytochrome c oxidase subunit 3